MGNSDGIQWNTALGLVYYSIPIILSWSLAFATDRSWTARSLRSSGFRSGDFV
jgi:hypothetical protein